MLIIFIFYNFIVYLKLFDVDIIFQINLVLKYNKFYKNIKYLYNLKYNLIYYNYINYINNINNEWVYIINFKINN